MEKGVKVGLGVQTGILKKLKGFQSWKGRQSWKVRQKRLRLQNGKVRLNWKFFTNRVGAVFETKMEKGKNAYG